MPAPSSSAMEEHLQRYGVSSDTGDDSDSSVGDITERRASSRSSAVAPVAQETSFWSTVFADTSHAIPNNVLGRWWREQHPFIAQFIRENGELLVQFLTPLTPHAARRAGFRGSCRDLLRTLDRVDVELPGGEGDWSSRWRSRHHGSRRDAAGPGKMSSVYEAVGGAGVAAVVVLVAAAVSWCSWRRSSPSWLLLLGELAIGSAGVAHYLAREDGYKEAKLLESHLEALERSLGPFFRGVRSCIRMVKCSQTLSFGLRLSVPMPPVARMESRLHATGSRIRPGQPEVALRELRSMLMDVLKGGAEQVNAYQRTDRRAWAAKDGDSVEASRSGSDASGQAGCHNVQQSLVDLVGLEKQLAVDLRRFVAEVAARVEGAMAGPEMWGLWWDSHLDDVSRAVEKSARYFEAAGDRLEMAIGSRGLPVSAMLDASKHRQVSEATDALSWLRLHYEEIAVRLYSCQCKASIMLRDPTKSTGDAWNIVRSSLEEARSSRGSLDGEDELWRKAEDLVKTIADEDSQTRTNSDPGAPLSLENRTDPLRSLEAGAGWVSLTTPRAEGPRVFEGGSGDEATEKNAPKSPDTGVADVLVGVPSPSRIGRCEGQRSNTAWRATPEELVDERSRAQLVDELDSVLRARPLPPICEKRLPLESQQYIGKEERNDSMVDHSSDEKQLGGVPVPLEAPTLPVAESLGSQTLMSELKAQLSMAANEEIFSSDRPPCQLIDVKDAAIDEGQSTLMEGDR
ncbi:unnamed protein product [Scytosiphon promiscuus]